MCNIRILKYMNKIRFIIAAFLVLSFMAMPVSASGSDDSAFFLCQKTDIHTGEPISPDSPQYDNVDYDNNIVNLIQPFINTVFIIIYLFGIVGGLYATIRDAFYSPTKDDDPAKYVKMRIGMITSGVGVPSVLIIGGYIAEFFTEYEVACIIPSPI